MPKLTVWCSYRVIAERLSARHLILLHGRLAFVYIYIRHAAWEREHAVWEQVAIHVHVRTCTGLRLELVRAARVSRSALIMELKR